MYEMDSQTFISETDDRKWGFSGIGAFAHLPHIRCLTDPASTFDIGIIGAPFDTAVSYRPGVYFLSMTFPPKLPLLTN